MKKYTEQFVRFNSITKLNEWLTEVSELATITYKQALNVRERVNYIIGFRVAMVGITNSNDIEARLKYLIDLANKINEKVQW